MPLITVITAVRNGARTIDRMLGSLARSRDIDIEHIVADGASSDDSVGIVRAAGLSSQIISEPDLGLADAWNKALARSSGHFVSFLNADDWYEPDFLCQALRAMLACNSDVVYGDVRLVNGEGRLEKVVRGRFVPKMLFAGMGFLHPSCMVRRSLFLDIGHFDLSFRLAMDCDWLLRAFRHGARFSHHDGSCSMDSSGMSNRHWIAARHEYARALRQNGFGLRARGLAAMYTEALKMRRNFGPR